MDFLSAVHKGDLAAVRQAIASGCDVNVAGPDGKTALHAAAVGSVSILKELLQAGCNTNLKDSKGRTAAEYARMYNYNGHANEIDNWAKRESPPPSLVMTVGKNRIEDVRAVLKMPGVNINEQVGDGKTALHAAAVSSIDVLKILLEAGCDTQLKDRKERTPAQYARAYGFVQQAQMIENWGKETGEPPGQRFLTAAMRNKVDDLRALIKQGVNINERWSVAGGKTALHVAAGHGYRGVVELLLSHDCATDIEDDKGRTAEAYAAHYNQGEIAKLLSEHGKKQGTEAHDDVQKKAWEAQAAEARAKVIAEEGAKRDAIISSEADTHKRAMAAMAREGDALRQRQAKKRKREEAEVADLHQSPAASAALSMTGRPLLDERLHALSKEILRCMRRSTKANIDESSITDMLRAVEVLMLDAKIAEVKFSVEGFEEYEESARSLQALCEAIRDVCMTGMGGGEETRQWVRRFVSLPCKEADILSKRLVEGLAELKAQGMDSLGTMKGTEFNEPSQKRKKTCFATAAGNPQLVGSALPVADVVTDGTNDAFRVKVCSSVVTDDGKAVEWSLHMHGPGEVPGASDYSPVAIGRTKHVALQHMVTSLDDVIHKQHTRNHLTLEDVSMFAKKLSSTMHRTPCPVCKQFGTIDPLTRVLVPPTLYLGSMQCLVHYNCLRS
eukprot:TRINITY_DN46775_c0_g1_i1.p1 TRINITY_DN46775_c0_g1~~TRINITY_DN46775_c0_g1_i1.p1  ORF type:complete len:682 (+),score=196.68 TRINITY_DN46775_c0_g1_i1:36-2048(+)